MGPRCWPRDYSREQLAEKSASSGNAALIATYFSLLFIVNFIVTKEHRKKLIFYAIISLCHLTNHHCACVGYAHTL